MDDFYEEVNFEFFWKYITYYHYHHNMKVTFQDHMISIETQYSHSEIRKCDYQIFEFQVKNTYTAQIEFYLHFQMKNMRHALDLFKEMMNIIETLVHKPKTKVLLACSGGLTTGYFAMSLNETVKTLHKDYIFQAVSLDQLEKEANDYDVILLAPQVSYHHATVQERFPSKIVLKIPSRIFAKYDTGKMLNIIEETQKKHYKEKYEPLSLCEITHEHGEILTLIFIRNSSRIHVGYRLFGRKNEILEDGEIIKTRVTLEDMFDFIDMMMVNHHHIDAIAIAMPGIINNGIVSTMQLEGMIDGTNIKEALKRRYYQKIILINDVNSIAVGYHACQNQYHNISVIFQPVSTNAGLGHIIEDQLHVGLHSLSGEIQYLPMVLSKSRFELNKTAEGTIELLTQIILSSMITIAPELIVVCSVLLPSVDQLKEELKKYIPEDYIPEIVQIDFLQDYSFIGSLWVSIRELYKTEKFS